MFLMLVFINGVWHS